MATARNAQKNAQNALKVEEGIISFGSHGLLEQPPSLFVGDGRIITIHISLSLLHLSTAVARKPNRAKTHTCIRWLLLDGSVGKKRHTFITSMKGERKNGGQVPMCSPHASQYSA